MKCENCRGIVVGAGFFQRIAHEKTCPRIEATRIAIRQFKFEYKPVRCDVCKENMTERGVMCDGCWKEVKAKP